MKIFMTFCLLLAAPLALAKQVSLDTTASKIEWLGQKKLPGDDHKGTVKIKSGTINLNEKGVLTGGTLIIDMKSINDEDLSGKYKEKLETHLNSEDFFHTAKHPEASFKITKVEPTRSNLMKVTGNLTIRGKTNPETFEVKIEKKGKAMVATGAIKFDRTKYGVTYNSETKGLKKAVKLAKDKIIKDEVQLTLNLQTKKI